MASGYERQDRGSGDAYASYFAGMDRSMQQKVALTTAHFPTAGRIADMGSGSGRGTCDLARLHPELEVVGVDINPAAVASAQAAYRLPNLRYVQGDIADPVFPPESLDGILDSSVLHHVTSFTGYGTRRLEECLDHQVAALRPGGVLIIRDFVVPDGPAEVALELREDDGAGDGPVPGLSTWALWRRYAATVRNGRWPTGGLRWSEAAAPAPGWRAARCALRDAQEFILRKDYRADWDVELLEEYCYWTQAEFVAALERRGMRAVTAAPIRNPWIVANRYRDRVRLRGADGAVLPFPPTNLVAVGRKLPPGEGARLHPLVSAPAPAPTFLRLSGWSAADGARYDLAERPGRTIDLLPWARRGEQVLVLARQGVPRPVAVADPGRPNLTGARWSGYLTEPIASIVDPAEGVAAAARRILAERAGVAASRIRGLGAPLRYATSPGGLDEVVDAVAVEIDLDGPLAPGVQALDARACLRAGQVGGLFDARLELTVRALLRRLGAGCGPWIGADPGAVAAAASWPSRADALAPEGGAAFAPLPAAGGYLDLRRGRFAELDPAGRVLAEVEREWVAPRDATANTASVLPVVAAAGVVLAGVERRRLPAIQRATGQAGFAAVPAWRLPAAIATLDQAEEWLRTRIAAELGIAVLRLVELGGPYLATPGATPELVHPWLALADPAAGPGALRWTALADCAADDPIDAHLAISAGRAAHALGIG